MPDPLQLPPHGLRCWLDTGKVLVVLPMELDISIVRDILPQGKVGFVYAIKESLGVTHHVGTVDLIETYAPYRPGDVLVPSETQGCLICVAGSIDECSRHKDKRYTVATVEAKRVREMTEHDWAMTGRTNPDTERFPDGTAYAWLVGLTRKE